MPHSKSRSRVAHIFSLAFQILVATRSNSPSLDIGIHLEYVKDSKYICHSPGRKTSMIIGDRLRELREAKSLSQGDIEKRTGLLRCYISRVENGHTVPAVETLEKMARALELPLYHL